MLVQIFSLCEAATDHRGKLNILGTFDGIGTKTLPLRFPQCSVAARILFEKNEGGVKKFAVSFIDADGRDVVPTFVREVEVKINKYANFASINIIVNYHMIELKNSGLYSIKLFINDERRAEIPFAVYKATTSQKPFLGEMNGPVGGLN